MTLDPVCAVEGASAKRREILLLSRREPPTPLSTLLLRDFCREPGFGACVIHDTINLIAEDKF